MERVSAWRERRDACTCPGLWAAQKSLRSGYDSGGGGGAGHHEVGTHPMVCFTMFCSFLLFPAHTSVTGIVCFGIALIWSSVYTVGFGTLPASAQGKKCSQGE